MGRARLWALASTLAATGVPACTEIVCGCLAPPPALVLYGTVTEAGGQPAGGAFVRVSDAVAADTGCRTAGVYGAATADGRGHYRTLVNGPFTADTTPPCLRLRIARFIGDSLIDVPVGSARPRFREQPPFDSARVDAQFPP